LTFSFFICEEGKIKKKNNDSKENSEIKTMTLRTTKNIEENLMYNEVKHSNSRTYFDEVNISIQNFLLFVVRNILPTA
jgi:hypothetical protein